MNKKAGRPPINDNNPRNYGLNIRLTKEEIEDIQYCADRLGATRANAVVAAIKSLKASLGTAAEPTSENLANDLISTIRKYSENDQINKLENLHAYISTRFKD